MYRLALTVLNMFSCAVSSMVSPAGPKSGLLLFGFGRHVSFSHKVVKVNVKSRRVLNESESSCLGPYA